MSFQENKIKYFYFSTLLKLWNHHSKKIWFNFIGFTIQIAPNSYGVWGMGNFVEGGGTFLLSGGNLRGRVFWPFKPFSKLKTTFCKYWTRFKTKISMTCVYKEYEVKIKYINEVHGMNTHWYQTFTLKPITARCCFSISPENVRKSKVFLFSVSIQKQHQFVIG